MTPTAEKALEAVADAAVALAAAITPERVAELTRGLDEAKAAASACGCGGFTIQMAITKALGR